MSRWIGFVQDPASGGTTLDMLMEATPPKILKPDRWLPATAATMEAAPRELNRNDEVRGRRANTPPMSFSAAPVATVDLRAYPKALRTLLVYALGGTITPTGTAPASIVSGITSMQEGNLPALMAWLLREEQLDRMTGVIVHNIELDFKVEAEGTIKAALEGLFRDTWASAAEAKEPGGTAAEAPGTPTYEGFDYTFSLRDLTAVTGSTKTPIEGLTEFAITFDNGMITDAASRYAAGHNVQKTTIDTVQHKLWWPAKHKAGAQNITGKIGLSGNQTGKELKHIFTHAELLEATVAAGPLATTPPAEELMKIIIGKHCLTGGGAEPLVREGDQRASFNFGGYLDSTTGKDIEVLFTGKEAVTLAKPGS